MDQADFLARVRAGLDGGPRVPLEVPPGWAATVEDAPRRFEAELTAAGGRFHSVNAGGLPAVIAGIVSARPEPRVVVTREVPRVAAEAVESAGGTVLWWPDAGREAAAEADFGITGALWAAAETGSVLVSGGPPGGRAPSLLPRAHVAVVPASRLVRTVADLFARIASLPERPSNLVVITGPSKTGDIENQLVTGVHGPVEAHVVLVHDAA